MRVALLLLLAAVPGAIPGSLSPAGRRRRPEGRGVQGQPRHPGAGLRQARALPRLQLGVVLRDLHPAVRLPHRLHRAAHLAVRRPAPRPPPAPRGAWTSCPPTPPGAPSAEPEEVREAALKLLKKRRFARTRTPPVTPRRGREGLSAGGRQPRLPHRVDRDADRLRLGPAVQVRGQQAGLEGDGFSNTLTQYDDFKSGNLFDAAHDLAPFSFSLKDFHGTYEATGPNRGTPRVYEAKVTYSEGADGAEKSKTIEVNKPLDIDGSKVYLVSHGYAPILTVKDAKGDVVMDKPGGGLLPLDANVTSSGAVKVMDGYRNAKGRRSSSASTPSSCRDVPAARAAAMLSTFPALINPMLALSAYHGDLGVRRGHPAERLPARREEPEGVQGLRRQAVQAAARGRRHHDPPERRRFGHLQRRPGVGRLPGHAAARQRLGARRCRHRHPGPGRFPVHPAAPGRVRAVRGADGVTVVEMAGLGRSRVREGPRGTGRDLAGDLYDLAPPAPRQCPRTTCPATPRHRNAPRSKEIPATPPGPAAPGVFHPRRNTTRHPATVLPTEGAEKK